jgi:hypothetical protein
MLTSFQCEVVAYLGDGDIYCPECAPDIDLGEGSFNDHGLIRYTVEEEWPGGLWCGECGGEIVEPNEDYCTEHDAWRYYSREDGEYLNVCDHVANAPNFVASDRGCFEQDES